MNAGQVSHDEVMEVRLARISERSDNLVNDFQTFTSVVEKTFIDIRSSIAGLSTELKERGKTPYPLFIGFGGLLLTIVAGLGTLAYSPIRDTEADIKSSLNRLNDQAITREAFNRLESVVIKLGDAVVTTKEFETYKDSLNAARAATATINNSRLDNQLVAINERVTKQQFADFMLSNQNTRDTTQANIKDRLDRLSNFVMDGQKTAVGIERYLSDQKAEDNRDQATQRQIDQIREAVSGIYNPRDALARIEKRNDTLEQELSVLQAKLAVLGAGK